MKSNICCALLLAASLQGANVKLHPDLQGRPGGDEVRVIVQYKETPGQAKRDRVAALGGRIHHELALVRGQALSVRVADLDRLAADPDVEAITLDHPVYASLDTAAAAINASAAWVTGLTGSGIGVAVIIVRQLLALKLVRARNPQTFFRDLARLVLGEWYEVRRLQTLDESAEAVLGYLLGASRPG